MSAMSEVIGSAPEARPECLVGAELNTASEPIIA